MSIVESSNNEQEFIDLDLSPIRKKRIRIDGDNKRIIEINTTDIGIVTRLNEIYPKLQELEQEYSNLKVEFDEEGNLEDESFNAIAEAIKDIDKKMRDYIDQIFDGPVADKCAPSGNMFDPINGSYRFEYVIDRLSRLYEEEISKNIQKRKDNIGRHTAKYTKSRKKK